jgi:FHS family L-fucose permease-like MFS transporter
VEQRNTAIRIQNKMLSMMKDPEDMTTIGPVIVSFAIFGAIGSGTTTLDLKAVQIPYLVLGAAFVLAAVMFKFSSVPDKIETVKSDNDNASLLSILKYPQLSMGMLAIFLYVGVEVSTASNLPEFMKQKLGTAEGAVAPFVSLYWASLMIGRWTSAAGVFDLSKSMKTVLGIVLPFVAFGIFAGANIIGGNDINELYPYLGIVVLLIVADYLSAGNPVKQIMIYSSLGAIAIAIGIFSSGMISVFAFISVGIFCSTLWPCIFTLSIAGMGENTNTASSLLIMMIMGGGFISVLQGALADDSVLGIQQSYWLGVACFAYLVFFAWSVSKILRNRGVDIFSSEKVAGH